MSLSNEKNTLGSHVVSTSSQTPTAEELLSETRKPSTPQNITKLPQKHSVYNPSVEDMAPIMRSIMRVFMSTAIYSEKNKKFVLFPYSWYLQKGDELILSDETQATVINVVDSDVSGNGFHNGTFGYQCGQLIELDREVDKKNTLLIPEERVHHLTLIEPAEDLGNETSPFEPPENRNLGIAYDIIKHYSEEGYNEAEGMELPTGDDGVPLKQIQHRMASEVRYYLYATTEAQLNGISRFFREMGYICHTLIQKAGYRRFYFKEMEKLQTVRRHTDVQSRNFRMLVRPLVYCIQSYEVEKQIVSTLDNIVVTATPSQNKRLGQQTTKIIFDKEGK